MNPSSVPWICLLVAGVLEIAWARGLGLAAGFSRPWLSLATAAAMIASLGLLAFALRTIPVGTAYAVWTGIGACGTALAGMCWFGEPRDLPRIACIAMIVAGVVGLKVFPGSGS